MKILTIILFSFCILMNPGISFQNSTKVKTITLQSDIKNPDAGLLKQSAGIISSRLNMYGIKSFNIKVSGPEQLQIEMLENVDMKAIEGLITSKGEIDFYETLTQNEISGLFQNDKEIYSILSPAVNAKPSDPRVGCSKDKQKAEANLKSLPKANSKFLWGNESFENGYCLFALKVSSDGRPLLTGSDIESVKFTGSGDADHKIQIKLKPSAVSVFADATKKNLNKAIAIVIDNQVYSWPVVRSAIEGGEVEVTGSFSENEIKYFPVMFSSGQLPFNMKVVK
jgi:preprotein translocase subunit SecD